MPRSEKLLDKNMPETTRVKRKQLDEAGRKIQTGNCICRADFISDRKGGVELDCYNRAFVEFSFDEKYVFQMVCDLRLLRFRKSSADLINTMRSLNSAKKVIRMRKIVEWFFKFLMNADPKFNDDDLEKIMHSAIECCLTELWDQRKSRHQTDGNDKNEADDKADEQQPEPSMPLNKYRLTLIATSIWTMDPQLFQSVLNLRPSKTIRSVEYHSIQRLPYHGKFLSVYKMLIMLVQSVTSVSILTMSVSVHGRPSPFHDRRPVISSQNLCVIGQRVPFPSGRSMSGILIHECWNRYRISMIDQIMHGGMKHEADVHMALYSGIQTRQSVLYRSILEAKRQSGFGYTLDLAKLESMTGCAYWRWNAYNKIDHSLCENNKSFLLRQLHESAFMKRNQLPLTSPVSPDGKYYFTFSAASTYIVKGYTTNEHLIDIHAERGGSRDLSVYQDGSATMDDGLFEDLPI